MKGLTTMNMGFFTSRPLHLKSDLSAIGLRSRFFLQPVKTCFTGLLAFALMQVLPACQRIDASSGVIKIIPAQDLIVENGKEVNWTFKGEKDGRALKIVNVTLDHLPLGVTVDFKNQDFVISGNAIPSVISEGNIYVTAFDEDACKQSVLEGLGFMDKGLAKLGFKVKGDNLLCEYNLHKESLFFAKTAIFPWFSAQFSDQFSGNNVRHLKTILNSLAEASLRSPVYEEGVLRSSGLPLSSQKINVFLVPTKEAPHQGLAYLDACYAYEFDQCGINSDCVWHSGGCASLSRNNLKQVGK